MNKLNGFTTPPKHLKFLAKKLFDDCGNNRWNDSLERLKIKAAHYFLLNSSME